jgi:radical SAM superfamily enzyme YgiQ (UPF0313 family)
MRLLFVHPGPLLYTKVFLRLEPLGLELVADAARQAGHATRLIDLQYEDHAAYHRLVSEWRPDLIAFSCNYLANVPEIVDLAKQTKITLPRVFICVGGHSASFTSRAIVEHGEGAIDDEGLRKFRKRIALSRNFEALEFARTLGVHVAINIIADPDWDESRFAAIREWCLEVPEIVNISINTPYPGTESWVTEERRLATRDYRLFDIQHAVLPTRLPLSVFYRELLNTQRVLYAKHLNLRTAPGLMRLALGLLMRGQTNFVRGMMLYPSVYNAERMLADHARPVSYQMPAPPPAHQVDQAAGRKAELYIHALRGRVGRHIDDATEKFVDETRAG